MHPYQSRGWRNQRFWLVYPNSGFCMLIAGGDISVLNKDILRVAGGRSEASQSFSKPEVFMAEQKRRSSLGDLTQFGVYPGKVVFHGLEFFS
jgi:hypothetical protein